MIFEIPFEKSTFQEITQNILKEIRFIYKIKLRIVM